MNLIVNAADAMQSSPEGARMLSVRTLLTGDAVQIDVDDRGPGIKPRRTRAGVRHVLDDQTRRYGHRSRDLPVDHGRARRNADGAEQREATVRRSA